jgi:hypothetical protein
MCAISSVERFAISIAAMRRTNAEVAKVLTWEEGRRVAANIAKLPERLKR